MKGTQYKIVQTSKEHIIGLWKVLDSVARERLYISFLEGPPIENLQNFIKNNLSQNSQSSIQFVALVDDHVIGWCDIIVSDRPIFQHTGTLGIGILEKYRGHGIGKALIKTALDKAKRNGLERVDLSVRGYNEQALRIYKNFGFQVEGVKKKAVRLDGTYEDVVMMALLLDR